MRHGQLVKLYNGQEGIYLGMEGSYAVVKVYLIDSRGEVYGMEVVSINPACIKG